MDSELGRPPRRSDAHDTLTELAGIDWLGAQAELDDCDGYVVLAVDPQTGEVDAHGPFPGLRAVEAAVAIRTNLDSDELTDVVVRIVRWHRADPGARAA